ncbi:aminotransferase class IV [Haloimpatiens lingqiaonensis]|uniref:aminotransferase class IV n=1 Tax=Haloimpatiens lingqiaonensis TaxID=1380675 RepID=UPI0010FD7D71|nr:aminotransferase class IV [Haloimpatiens lingqiaonensis]
MSECIKDFYILNGEIKNTNCFHEKYLKEGRALYEVIRIIDGVPLYLENHLERLQNTAKLTGDKLWLTVEEIKNNMQKLVKINDVKIGNIKMVFNFNENKDFLVYFVKHSYPTEQMYKEGVKTILYHGERTNPKAKVIDMEFRSKVTEEINKNQAFEAILVDREGYITEGSKSNIFMIQGSEVITSPCDKVLPGVTRAMIIHICNNIGVNVREERFHFKNIDKLDALFISGTSPKVLPIKQVGEFKFNSSNNAVLNNIRIEYDKNIENYIKEKL